MWSPMCLLGRHVPDRSRVRDGGDMFHAPCKRCATELVRDLSGWRKADAHEGSHGGRFRDAG